MISYFDTSAIVPLVVAEPSSVRCARVWQECDVRVSSMLAVAEAHAALAQAHRVARLTDAQHTAAVGLLAQRFDELDLVVPTREIVDRAAELAVSLALRGYDAVHAATALAVSGPEFAAVTGDRALADAWVALGVDVIDVNM